MANWLYNGVALPELPELTDEQKAQYPYAYILYNAHDDAYTFERSTVSMSFNNDWVIWGDRLVFRLVDGVWEFAYETPNNGSGLKIIWCNQDVLWSSGGAVAYAASNPIRLDSKLSISVKNAEEGNLIYNGVELPDINTVWTDKTTYPHAYIFKFPAYYELVLSQRPFVYGTVTAPDESGNELTVTCLYVLTPSGEETKISRYLFQYGSDWIHHKDETLSMDGYNLYTRYEGYSAITWVSSGISNVDDNTTYFYTSTPLSIVAYFTCSNLNTTDSVYKIAAWLYPKGTSFLNAPHTYVSNNNFPGKDHSEAWALPGMSSGTVYELYACIMVDDVATDHNALVTFTTDGVKELDFTHASLSVQSGKVEYTDYIFTLKYSGLPYMEDGRSDVFDIVGITNAGDVAVMGAKASSGDGVIHGTFVDLEPMTRYIATFKIYHNGNPIGVNTSATFTTKQKYNGGDSGDSGGTEGADSATIKHNKSFMLGFTSGLGTTAVTDVDVDYNVWVQGYVVGASFRNALNRASGGIIPAPSPVVLEVAKMTSDTYAASTTYSAEEFILLDIYPKTNGTVSVTYGGLTKTITDTSGAESPNAQRVFFGAFNGVSDETETPDSGILVIEGDYESFAVGSFEYEKNQTTVCDCITAVAHLGNITSIVPYMFRECVNLTSVAISNRVTSIGNLAFYGCAGLMDVTIPDSVIYLGSHAFSGCTSLKSVIIPSSVTENMGNNAFSDCTSLRRVVLSEGVTVISNNAFSGCTSLRSIIIPNSVKTIQSHAFSGCTSLTGLNIPKDVTTLGTNPFRGMHSANYLSIADENTAYRVINNCLIETNTGRLVSGFAGGDIPEGVTEIGQYAFYGCEELIGIMIPASVTTIGSSAFSRCTALKDVVIDNGVTTIESSAFSGCGALTSVTLPDSVTTIGSSAFQSTALTSITIPEKVTSIGTYMFYQCADLAEVNILGRVTDIGQRAFNECTSLTGITIPDSVITIGDYAFYRCKSLTNAIISDGIITIGSNAFYMCEALTNINIPEGVTSIGSSAFQYTGLTSITIPASVESVGSSAFRYCSKLNSVTLSDGLAVIGEHAFNECTSLTSITIPGSVSTIGHASFSDCSALTSVTLCEGIKATDNAVFMETGLRSVTIPSSMNCINFRTFAWCDNLSSVTFKNTSGWYVTTKQNGDASTGTAVSVTNTGTNATMLKETYMDYYWYREET